MKKIKIALLHLLPIAAKIEYNQGLIEKAIKLCKNRQIDWIITPELVVSGLQFANVIGTDWIKPQPDAWMTNLFSLVKSIKTNLFLGCPEKDEDDKLYNTVFVIGSSGKLLGKQQKISSITDEWSSSGTIVEPITIAGLKVGILICADAYTQDVANTLLARGAQILVAPSAWGPGLYGPKGEWEQRSIDTGLPIIVCNRTGEDESVTFWEAESSIIINGRRVISHKSEQSCMLTFEWDLEKMEPISTCFEVEKII